MLNWHQTFAQPNFCPNNNKKKKAILATKVHLNQKLAKFQIYERVVLFDEGAQKLTRYMSPVSLVLHTIVT